MKRAIGYARCSTTKQEKSIPEQKAEIERFANERDYGIERFFEDFGISGVQFEHRRGFQEMLRYCRDHQGAVDAVIVWDKSRFGRPEHPKEATAFEWQLEQFGIEIVYASTGRRSDGSTGAVFQDLAENVDAGGKLVELGGSITRHQIDIARSGWSTGRKPPFGYDLLVLKPEGTPRHRVHFVPAGSKNRYKRLLLDAHTGALLEEVPPERRLEKPRCDRTKLVAGDPVEQSVVKRIFAQYRAGRGYRKIACELNQAGAPCPNGRHWEMSCVKSILENPVYRGALVTGMRREGRFFVMQGDRATRRKNAAKTSAGNVRVEKKAESEWIVSEGAHDALVPPEEWHAVQQRKTSRETRRTHAGVRTSYLLAGLTKCMRCGFRYQGRTARNVKGIESRSYTCGGYHAGGTSICRMGSIAKDAIENPILEMIRKIYFEIEDEAALEEGIREELGRAASADGGAAEIATLRKRRQALQLKIDAWLEELTILPQSARAMLRDKLATTAKEIEWCDAEIARLEDAAPEQGDVEEEVAQTLATIREWRTLFEGPDVEAQKEAVRFFVSEIRIDFEAREVAVGFYNRSALFRIGGRGERI